MSIQITRNFILLFVVVPDDTGQGMKPERIQIFIWLVPTGADGPQLNATQYLGVAPGSVLDRLKSAFGLQPFPPSILPGLDAPSGVEVHCAEISVETPPETLADLLPETDEPTEE